MYPHAKKLEETVAKIFTHKKGILAADESNRTAGRRLSAIGLENNEDNRRKFRDLFLSTKDIEKYLSGVILYDETFWQASLEGRPFVQSLTERGIVPGIKVDKGLVDLPQGSGDQYTQGLDGLDARMEEYAAAGAGFAKWRAAFAIDIAKGLPSDNAIRVQSNIFAIYAGICQRHGVVPIVEPEVLMTGTYSIDEKYQIMKSIFTDLFLVLKKNKVYLPGVILKTSICHSGHEAEEWADIDDVADKTADLLENYVPEELGGVVFLSGGLSKDTATKFFNAISKNQSERMRDKTTFSFSRAIQTEPMDIWGGSDENLEKARKRYVEILKDNALAERGKL